MAAKAEVIIVGAAGRVGLEIAEVLRSHRGAKLYAGVDHKGRAEASRIENVRPVKRAVAIDFSSPAGLRKTLSWCLKSKTPLVSGTTGLTLSDVKALTRASKKIPVLWSANMSEGINIFLNLIEALGPNLKDYDLQLEEVHHRRKKDAPSGTAKILRDRVERLGGKMPVPLSIRGGGVFGIHKLWLLNEDEIITIEHSALNRRVFARGAVEAAVWVLGRRAGLYSMQDVLRGARR